MKTIDCSVENEYPMRKSMTVTLIMLCILTLFYGVTVAASEYCEKLDFPRFTRHSLGYNVT